MHPDLVVLRKGLLFLPDCLLTLNEPFRTGELALTDLLDMDGVGALAEATHQWADYWK